MHKPYGVHGNLLLLKLVMSGSAPSCELLCPTVQPTETKHTRYYKVCGIWLASQIPRAFTTVCSIAIVHAVKGTAQFCCMDLHLTSTENVLFAVSIDALPWYPT